MRTSLSSNSHAWEHLVTLVLLACHVRVSVQQRDPIDDFCRRWGHQAAVVDDKLFIDGGLITYSGSENPENVTNPYLIYHDLSTVASSGMPPPYANLSKNSTIPNVNGGIFWPDDVNKRIYLFGGEFYDETPWSFDLYAYDIINDYWDNYGSPRSPDIMGLSYGAGLSISSRGEGYYYGGWMNNATDPDWGDAPGLPTSYMLMYDMDTNTWSNTTGPDNIGRAEGVMIYLPAGDGGLILYFGGIRATSLGGWEGQPMEEIMIYDILSGKSYLQNATGDVPEMRRRFCAGATWVDDQSSYNIYLYGGLGEAVGSSGFDDIYILSIPTFTWIKMYPATNGTGDFPHHSLTCNVVNEAQMIVHGGFFPLNNECDSSAQWGLHNMDLGRQNDDKSPWALYVPDKTKYVVPTDVLSVVGGKSTGGATNTAPADGFSHQDLKVLMTRKASVAVRSATRNVGGATETGNPDDNATKDSGLSTGAIVGIGIGGAAVAIVALVAAWCLLRRRRQRRGGRDSTNASQQPMNQSYDYHPAQTSSHFSQGPWSPGSSHFNTASPPPFHSDSPQTVQSNIRQAPPVELPTEVNDTPHVSPYGETPATAVPKYDAQGNLWVPQITMMETNESPGSPHYEQSQSYMPKYDQGYSPSRTPQELATEAERATESVGRGPHQTYYHP